MSYAQFFVDAGIAVLTFDYRNLGESEGEPRQHIIPWEQIYDIINGITYVTARDDVDPARIGVWGISYAGGHVFPVAALDPRVRTIFSIVKGTVAPNHEHWTTIQSCEYVLSYDVTPYPKRIIHQPTLMVTSWYDDITMTEFEVPAFHTIPSPRKKLVQVGEGASHMSLYDNPDHLRVVGQACAAFAREHH